MTNNEKVIIVMPAYNAEKTLLRTFRDIPKNSYDEIILVDDASRDHTVKIANSLGLTVICHEKNRGYGGNQKTCYKTALDHGADIVVMLHPDYQYDPVAIPRIIEPLIQKNADMVIASRFLKRNPHEQGMPLYKYISNMFLTFCQNYIFRQQISEYHSGYRAYTRELLTTIPFDTFSENFVFDSQMLAEAAGRGFRLAEIDIPTRYFEEASQTSFRQSLRYGLSTLGTLFAFATKYRIPLFIRTLGLIAFLSACFWSATYPQGRPLSGDALEFHSLALGIKDRLEFGGGEWFARENPSMWREPAYPVFLATIYGILGTSVPSLLATQGLLFAISTILFFFIFKKLSSPSVAGLASFLYALSPQFAYRAGYVGSDLPFVVILSVVLWLSLTKAQNCKTALIVGICIGLATLIRTASLFLPFIFVLLLLWKERHKATPIILFLLFGFCIITGPWMIRNKILFNTFAVTNRSGLMLHSRAATLDAGRREYAQFFTASFIGDYPVRFLFRDYSPARARYLAGLDSRSYEVDLFLQGTTPSEMDLILKQEGLAAIKHRPIKYIRDFIPNIGRLNTPIIPRASTQALFEKRDPKLEHYKYFIFALSFRIMWLICMFLAILGIAYHVIRGNWMWILVGAYIIYFNILYGAFAPVERFSMPLIPLYLIAILEALRIFVPKLVSHLSQYQTSQSDDT